MSYTHAEALHAVRRYLYKVQDVDHEGIASQMVLDRMARPLARENLYTRMVDALRKVEPHARRRYRDGKRLPPAEKHGVMSDLPFGGSLLVDREHAGFEMVDTWDLVETCAAGFDDPETRRVFLMLASGMSPNAIAEATGSYHAKVDAKVQVIRKAVEARL